MRPSILDEHLPEARPLARRVGRAVDAFFFTPASARPLAALRIGIAAVLLTQAWMLRGAALELFAQDGIVQGDLARHIGPQDIPRIQGVAAALSRLGVGETSFVHLVCGVYVASLLLLAAGCFTRAASALAWLLHLFLINSSYSATYGLDQYAHVFLFYLMWSPSGRAWSLDVLWGRVSAAPTPMSRVALRIMQIHMCLSYLTSGAAKAAGIQWWNGEILWRAMSVPVYHQVDAPWLARWPVILQLGSLATLAIELGYCVLIWPARTRRPWILATVALHAGIAVFLGLQLFAAIMCVLTPALFAVSPEPREPGAPPS